MLARAQECWVSFQVRELGVVFEHIVDLIPPGLACFLAQTALAYKDPWHVVPQSWEKQVFKECIQF